MLAKSAILAWLVILDGIRRNAIVSLFLFSLILEAGGILFIDFIPQDVGRFACDFVLSVGFLAGFVFLLLHAVQVIAWDEERRVIHTYLARPISRTEYVVGVFFGLMGLLFLLDIMLSISGYWVLLSIKGRVNENYFQSLSVAVYILAWLGLFASQLIILVNIMLFSGLVRGNFAVLILTLSFYFICTSLPVVREAYSNDDGNGYDFITIFFTLLTAIFPDLRRFDYKASIAEPLGLIDFAWQRGFVNVSFLIVYIVIIVALSAVVYGKRDLQ